MLEYSTEGCCSIQQGVIEIEQDEPDWLVGHLHVADSITGFWWGQPDLDRQDRRFRFLGYARNDIKWRSAWQWKGVGMAGKGVGMAVEGGRSGSGKGVGDHSVEVVRDAGK